MQTHTAYVLWLNLCADARNTQDLTVFDTLDTLFTIKPVDSHQITTFVSTKCPQIICLEYDFPDRHGLLLLRQLRSDYPSIPIIMLTTKSCESLAIWAFRTGVRDYLVKPLPASSMVGTFNSIASLLTSSTLQNPHTPRRNILSPPIIPHEFRHGKHAVQTDGTVLAVCYIENHYAEKIAEKDLAELCGMNVFAFSKIFRREHNMTFREFLLRYRIERAKEFLQNPRLTSTDVSGLVGFSDASSFTRLFKRYVGLTPSMYRRLLPR